MGNVQGNARELDTRNKASIKVQENNIREHNIGVT